MNLLANPWSEISEGQFQKKPKMKKKGYILAMNLGLCFKDINYQTSVTVYYFIWTKELKNYYLHV